jgi:hypothetical protein
MLSALDAVIAPGSRIGEVRDFRTGPAMSTARNHIGQLFLDSPFEWLWMIDADMIISARTLPALLDAADPEARPVMGALAFIQTGPQPGEQIPNMWQAVLTEGGQLAFKSWEQFPLGEVVQVGATGGACLLLHRSVLELMNAKLPDYAGLWFAEITTRGTLFGEDFSFCMRCAQLRIPVHVHTGARVAHTKSMIIGEVFP